MTFRLLLSLTAMLLWSQAALAQAAPEPKLALLIGNAAYKSSPLRNPVNDVRLMEAVLKESGFTVIKAENASMREMRRLVREFGDRLKADGGVGLFYFAGHGVQMRGENFLISTDSDIHSEDEVADDGLNANLVLEKMQTAGNRVNLVILDACRNNPFPSRSRSAQEGLAGMRAPGGSLVAYATAPGSVASDGPGRNGLYTENLARAIRQPGLPIEEVFKQVRTAVRKQSNNQQIPWENTALEGEFFFRGRPAPPQPDAATLDLAFWESVKSGNSPADLQAYLTQFPDGVFAGLAKGRLVQLKTAGPVTEVSKVPAALPGAPELVGTLVSTDVAYGQKNEVAVTVSQRNSGRVVYSSGDIVANGGRIEQLRVGDVVVKVMSGSLWTLPARAGAEGRAGIERLDAGWRSTGTITWKSVDVGGGKIRIDADVSYHYRYLGVYDERVYGRWSATYSGQRDLPDSTSARLEGLMGGRNVVSAEFTPR